MFKNKSCIWWILIGWWLAIIYYFGIWWWLTPLKKFLNKNKTKNIKVSVKSWGKYNNNITEWQKSHAKDQWINANFTSKNLYQFSWMNDIPAKLIHDKTNEFDTKAILVLIDNIEVGYIPKPINEQHFKSLLSAKNVKAAIHGGNAKYKDEYGDIILNAYSPLVDLYIEL